MTCSGCGSNGCGGKCYNIRAQKLTDQADQEHRFRETLADHKRNSQPSYTPPQTRTPRPSHDFSPPAQADVKGFWPKVVYSIFALPFVIIGTGMAIGIVMLILSFIRDMFSK